MTCAKDKCIHREYCQRHIGQQEDGCVLYKRDSSPMTNEEYLRSAGTDGLTAIFMRFMFDAEFKARFVNGNFITEFRKWLKEIHE